MLPSSQQTVTVHLEDCDGAVFAGRVVDLTRSPVQFPSRLTANTDDNGDAHFTALLGVADAEESIYGSYRRPAGDSYGTERHGYAVQRGQSGQLQFGPTVPVVHPGGSLVLQITSRDPVTGTPQPAKPIVFESNLGGLQQGARGTTDATGALTTSVLTGNTVGLGQVDAFIPAPSPARDTQTHGRVPAAPNSAPPNEGYASEYLVVSSPVALNLIGPTGQVLAGMAVPITGTLLLDDWYVHTLGGGNTWLGAYPHCYPAAAFSPSGDKIYFEINPTYLLATGFLEVDRATGTTRTLSLPTPLQLYDYEWTLEPGGILYFDRAAGMLRRLDLTSGQTLAVGALPAGADPHIVP